MILTRLKILNFKTTLAFFSVLQFFRTSIFLTNIFEIDKITRGKKNKCKSITAFIYSSVFSGICVGFLLQP